MYRVRLSLREEFGELRTVILNDIQMCEMNVKLRFKGPQTIYLKIGIFFKAVFRHPPFHSMRNI
jgi:hypothetical protein